MGDQQHANHEGSSNEVDCDEGKPPPSPTMDFFFLRVGRLLSNPDTLPALPAALHASSQDFALESRMESRLRPGSNNILHWQLFRRSQRWVWPAFAWYAT